METAGGGDVVLSLLHSGVDWVIVRQSVNVRPAVGSQSLALRVLLNHSIKFKLTGD